MYGFFHSDSWHVGRYSFNFACWFQSRTSWLSEGWMKMIKHVIHEKQIGPLYTMIPLKDKFWPLVVGDIGNIGVLFFGWTPPNCFASGCVYQLSSSAVQEKKTNLAQGWKESIWGVSTIRWHPPMKDHQVIYRSLQPSGISSKKLPRMFLLEKHNFENEEHQLLKEKNNNTEYRYVPHNSLWPFVMVKWPFQRSESWPPTIGILKNFTHWNTWDSSG